MEWLDPSPYIENSTRIADIFGYWPSFHNAEIRELRLNVAERRPWVAGSESPLMEMQIHVFELTKERNPGSYFVLRKHTLTQLRFRNVENLQLSDFTYRNCIFGLVFGLEPMSYPNGGGPIEGPPPNVLSVQVDSSCGLSARFKCQAVGVTSAEPCDENGNLLTD